MEPSFFETAKEVPCIKVLSYIPDYITAEQEEILLTTICAQAWSSELKRRVQHYGYKYDYKARTGRNFVNHYLRPSMVKRA